MASFGPERGFVVKKLSEEERLGLDYSTTMCNSMMTAGLGRSGSGAPTLTSLYNPRNAEHKLARAKLFDESAQNCCEWPHPTRQKEKIVCVMHAFDFIRRECKRAYFPEDIWHGVFEEHHMRFICDNHLDAVYADFPVECLFLLDSSEFKVSENYLMVYINLLEAAVLALEMEKAISMFAEDEQITNESLTSNCIFLSLMQWSNKVPLIKECSMILRRTVMVKSTNF